MLGAGFDTDKFARLGSITIVFYSQGVEVCLSIFQREYGTIPKGVGMSYDTCPLDPRTILCDAFSLRRLSFS